MFHCGYFAVVMVSAFVPTSFLPPRAATSAPKVQKVEAPDLALAEVNAVRAQRGLHPFIEDKLLTQAAQQAASIRAQSRIQGHLSGPMGDFGCLPPGAHADAAGCAAWPVSMGWGACCTYDNYRFAGAAYVIGPDGQRYMHLFVRR